MHVLYFAWLRERVGVTEEVVSPPLNVTTVTALMDWLASRSAGHAAALKDRNLIRVAVDQVHSPHTASIAAAREVAFFPPVTGG